MHAITAAQNRCKQRQPFFFLHGNTKYENFQSVQADIYLNWIDVLSILWHRQFLEN